MTCEVESTDLSPSTADTGLKDMAPALIVVGGVSFPGALRAPCDPLPAFPTLALVTLFWVSPSGHGVASIPIRVLYSHAGPVGTAEDLSSQTTKSKYHVIRQVIQITCKVT